MLQVTHSLPCAPVRRRNRADDRHRYRRVVTQAAPARADSSCGASQVCVWSGTSYTGAKTAYDFADLADLGCVNVTFLSLKIGAGSLTTAVTQYGEETCFVLANREDTVSLLGTPTGNPETNNLLGAFTAHSFSFLQIGG